MGNWRAVCAAVVLAAALSQTAIADPDECREAIDQFNTSRSGVFLSLKTYANCVASNDGHDDCSLEFSTLQSDQDDFESAVSSYESDCN